MKNILEDAKKEINKLCECYACFHNLDKRERECVVNSVLNKYVKQMENDFIKGSSNIKPSGLNNKRS